MPYKNKEKQKEYQKKHRAQRRLKGIELLGGKCNSCGATEDLEFDHINPEEKTSHRIWSWSWIRIEEELAKCQLLCADCHKAKSKDAYGELQHGTTTMYGKMKCRCEPCVTRWNDVKRTYRSNGGAH